VEIKEQFQVPVPPEVTYRALNDVGAIGQCIAGVQEVTVIDDDRSRWKLEVRAGFMELQFGLDARIVERVADRRIGFAAEGQDVTLTGHVDLSASHGSSTECEVFIDAVIGGPLGPMADIMAQGPQEALVAETVRNLRARLEAMAPAAAAGNGSHSRAPDDDAAPPQIATQADDLGPPRARVRISAPHGRPADMAFGGLLLLIGIIVGRLTRPRSTRTT
jgi:carbon monoxide dehydrogenase subunit G